MHQLSGTVAAWQESGETGWLVRAVDAVGFGARRDVESMLVRSDGTFEGEILAPPIAERIAHQVAANSYADTSAEFELSIHGDDALDAGLTCGGSLHLVVQPVASIPTVLVAELHTRAPVAYAVRLDVARPGMLVVDAKGASTSTLGDALVDQHVVDVATAMLERGQSARRIERSGGARLLLDVYEPTARALIVGHGDLANALAAQLALIDWDVDIVGDVVAALAAVDQLARMDAVIVLSHDPAVDAPVLAAALRGDVGYVGALGSRRTQAARAERLEAQGLDARHLAAVHGPAGLDIGASGPAETAVSIVAEILAVRSGRSAEPLRSNDNPIHVTS
jgi:xanthine dehydrogenase accessory factor